MEKEDVKLYNSDLNIDGTIPQLVDWAVRYSEDYSDEALDEISRRAEELGFTPDTVRIPQLVKASRHRAKEQPDTLPYEDMQLDHLRGFRIGFSETKEYGDVEIMEDRGMVVLCITGTDDSGFFTASNAFDMEEFMFGKGSWLECAVGATLFYGKIYEEQGQSASDAETGTEGSR